MDSGTTGIAVIVRTWYVGLGAAICAIVLAGGGLSGASERRSDGGLPGAMLAQAEASNPTAGALKVGLVLPLSLGSEAGAVSVAMRKAVDMAVAENAEANLQIIFKDDGGNSPGAQRAAREAIEAGASVILGSLFAQPTIAMRQVTRDRGVPVIAFSSDAKAAAPGVYLLSFLPEAEVDRVVAYAMSQGKRAFVGLLPPSPYGKLLEVAFKQAVARAGGKLLAVETYKSADKIGDIARQVAPAAGHADAMFIPAVGKVVSDAMVALAEADVDPHRFLLLGTQLWDDPKIGAVPLMEGGVFAGPDPAGFRAFADRYRRRYGADPPHLAAHAYDAVALIAALVKAHGAAPITDDMLTAPAGFSGIDGMFRFRPDGTIQRTLAVLRITPAGPKVVAAASRGFGGTAK